MRILVTGASGAIGGALTPELARAGHEVTAFARAPARVTCDGAARVVQGDALTGAGLDEALEAQDLAYYLIHSMEPAADGGGATFPERERTAAARFSSACERAGVRRVVYLGGLVPAGRVPSEHLASRLAVEQLLLGCAPESVALRASIVISAASRSFRFLVRLVERTPVLPLPSWRDHRTQPIDGRDVIAYLVAAGASPRVGGPLSLDIAGPDVVSYGELVQRIRDALLLGRPELRLPCSLTPVASAVASAISGEEIELVSPLMQGLTGDLLPRDERARALFDVRLHRLDAAIERALRDWEAVEELAGR